MSLARAVAGLWLDRLVHLAQAVESQVLVERHRADRSIARVLSGMPELAVETRRMFSEYVFSLFRWRGWVEPISNKNIYKKLLYSSLLDQGEVQAHQLALADRAGVSREVLRPIPATLGWEARAECLGAIAGGLSRPLDPCALVPEWVLPRLLRPDPGGPAPACWLEWLQAIQQPADLWVRSNESDPGETWEAFDREGLQPRVHGYLRSAAEVPREADLPHHRGLDGRYAIQDLGSQAVGAVCDPDPGERWWDVCAGAGGKALDLAARMRGKGLVIATDTQLWRLREAAARARAAGFSNIQTRAWDGRSLVGKAGRCDGVLVDAPCSGIGTWRGNPDARWTLEPGAISRLAELQLGLLQIAAGGVKPGGTLVYAVCTLTREETEGVLGRFLDGHPEYVVDPVRHPLSGAKTQGVITLWPQHDTSNGMFIARCVKRVSGSVGV